jgi:hypothetical protein
VRARRSVAAGLALLAATGCAFTDINIVQDRRIALTGLKEGQTVEVPFTLTWDVRKAIAPGHEVSYAVFVDRTAIKPGRTVKSIVPSSDRNCWADAACPDTAYLARHGVYVVTEPRVTVPRVKPTKEREAHRVTVVILVDGKRDGEGAFSRIVYVEGED